MKVAVGPKQLSDVIGAIYDCAVDPGLWPTAIEQVAEFVQGANGVVMVVDTVEQRNRFFAAWNADPEAMRVYSEKYHADNPLNVAFARFAVDEPYNIETALDPKVWLESRVYREFGAAQGWLDSLGVSILRTPTRQASLSFARKQEFGFSGSRELDILRLLSPHVRRAISITDLLDMRAVTADAAEATLESLSVAVVLVDGAGRITFANGAARALIDAGDPIRADHGMLAASDAAAASLLATAVARTREPDANMGKIGIDVPVPYANGRPSFAHVLPIGSSAVRGMLSSNATAAVFLAPAGAPAKLPAAALAANFGFTPTETRILELLVEGRTISDAGASLGIAPTTARTHLARIMDKTGTERQADLIRLISGSLPPVRRSGEEK